MTGVEENPVKTGTAERYLEIDLLRAVSIIAVVLIHAITHRELFTLEGATGFLNDLTRFAVPGFLFVSGFLFEKNLQVRNTDLGWKLFKRIIPPYLICSFGMLWLRTQVDWLDGRITLNSYEVTKRIILGNSVGIYYFIFVLIYLYIFALIWRKWPRNLLWGLVILEVVAVLDFYLMGMTFVFPENGRRFFLVLFRHPIVHLLPFLVGWMFALYYKQIRAWLDHYALEIILFASLVDILMLITMRYFLSFSTHQLMLQVHIYAAIITILALGIRFMYTSSWLQFFSQSSYALFLLHYPIVRGLQELCSRVWGIEFPMKMLISWIGGLLITAGIVWILQKMLGRNSRWIIGA